MRPALIVLAASVLVAAAVLLVRSPDRAVERPPAGIVVVPAGDRPSAGAHRDAFALTEGRPAVGGLTSEDDRAWASSSEGVLRVELRQVPMLDQGDNLRIACAAARCTATARLPAGLEGENRAMYWRFVQGPAVRERMAELGLPLGDAQLRPDDRFVLRFTKAP